MEDLRDLIENLFETSPIFRSASEEKKNSSILKKKLNNFTTRGKSGETLKNYYLNNERKKEITNSGNSIYNNIYDLNSFEIINFDHPTHTHTT